MPPKETCAAQFFGFVPPPYTLRDPGYPPPESFLHFPDTHLDENLILKRICVLPSLVKDIFGYVDTLFPVRAQRAYKDAMYAFSRMPYPDRNDNYTVNDVRNPYTDGIPSAALQLVSGIIIHPDDPYMGRIVGWQPNPSHTDYNTPFHDEDFVLKMANLAEKDFEAFSASSQERIRPLMDQIPVVALGILLCPNGAWCLEQMDELVPLPDAGDTVVDFPWLVNSYPTGHPPTPSAVRPPDAENSLWHLPKSAPPTTSALRTSNRTHKHGSKDPSSRASSASQSPAPKHFKPKDIRPAPSREASGARDLLQRAWFKAVRFDVSVILFDCGNLLRIGIRHRQTQTLYLTPIVDVCEPESYYSKLMLGMHLCIFHDAFGRLAPSSMPPPDEPNPPEDSHSSKKRDGEHLSKSSPSKRGRTAEPSSPPAPRPSTASRSSRRHDLIRAANTEKKKVSKDLRLRTHTYFKTRPVLVLYIQYGAYNSPTPEVLLSPDQARSKIYKAKKCLPIILTAKLGRGATGKAYTAVLGPGHERVPCSRLVAKIADNRENLVSLRHEYDVYCHLQATGVSGIPYVFGYYQDDTRGLGALVMHDVGNPLGRRMDSDKKIMFSAAERSSLKKVLEGIHSNGVLHRDLRSWNMMCNQHGELSIIDFDRASLRASMDDFAQESARLDRFLQGEFIDRDSIIGSHGLPSDMENRIVNPGEAA